MVFSSTFFLFVFLPVTLLLYFFAGRAFRNGVLLCASLFFYAWGENVYVLLMFASICSNYFFGLVIDRARQRGGTGKSLLTAAVVVNLGFLAFFKYLNFFVDTINEVLSVLQVSPIALQPVHLPIGISFFTFQAISYIVDLYRGHSKVQKNPFDLALYIALFPQLIAGPIVRYHDIAADISGRCSSIDDIYAGARRFIIGLGKKVLVANVLGETADYIFSLPPDRLFMSLAWLGAIAYTLQIYYDFSGYSDMAIGLGRMFGFRFPENFNYPYISRSIRDFWQRWHISLSSWLRDYLYIPLGGSRVSTGRTYLNLFIVFLLCGLWHGASWTFVLWGAYYGLFIVLEKMHFFARTLNRFPAIVKNLYVLIIVICGWVLFRAESVGQALSYLQAMIQPGRTTFFNSPLFLHLNNEFYVVLVLAVIGATPFPKLLFRRLERGVQGQKKMFSKFALSAVFNSGYLLYFYFLFSYSISSIVSGSYNPFLYFRF